MKRTICALSTPPGIGGLAVIRISGDEAFAITDQCFSGKTRLSEVNSHTIHYGKFKDGEKLIDTVTASVFVEPQSYTGENVVELSCHGGYTVSGEVINALIKNGAVPAEPGEFTRRSFLNGKLDLTQVEAVADIIHSNSVPGCQTAARQLTGQFTSRLSELRRKLIDTCSLLELELDFADEDLEFVDRSEIADKIVETREYCLNLAESFRSAEILRSGFFIGIAGFPNSGKSTLFNALLERRRAIVSETPGTTRDYLEETIHLDGIAVRLIDTAGLRATEETIEIEGIKLAESVLEQANMIVVLNDISEAENQSDELFRKLKERYRDTSIILVHNKIDKVDGDKYPKAENVINISAKTGESINELKNMIGREAAASAEAAKDVLINQRHAALLKDAAASLNSALEALNTGMENEFVSIDIRKATGILGELTGETWSEDILNNIFSRFCIGK